MKSFVNFSENLEDKKQQLMQKQKVMQQMERERASRSNQEFQLDKEEKQSRMDQEKEEEKRLEQIKKEIKKEIKQEMEVDEEFGKMTKKQTQAYTGMDDKEQKALYKKMKKDGNFDVKKNLSGAASDDKDISEELNKDDKPFVKKLVGKLRSGSKTHAKQAADLEKAVDGIRNFFFKDGVQMVVDGYSLEELTEIMETRIEYREKRENVQKSMLNLYSESTARNVPLLAISSAYEDAGGSGWKSRKLELRQTWFLHRHRVDSMRRELHVQETVHALILDDEGFTPHM